MISQLKASGSFRADRHSKREQEPTSGTTVKMPRSLKGEAAKFWRANVPKLEIMGVLDGIDEATLVGLATAWANWRKEQAAYEDGTGHVYRVSCSWTCFAKIASRFGLNPVDRTKLGTSEEPSDRLAEFIRASKN